MNAAELRDYCLSLLGTDEQFPFGPDTSAFKVAGKIFALSRLSEHPLRVSLKCDPSLAEELRKAHPAVIPGVSPQQAPLEHRHHRRLTARRDHQRHDRGFLRPDRQQTATPATTGAQLAQRSLNPHTTP
jgi:hypothetical protein